MKIRACPMWLGAYNVGPQIKIFKLNYPGSKLEELPDEFFLVDAWQSSILNFFYELLSFSFPEFGFSYCFSVFTTM